MPINNWINPIGGLLGAGVNAIVAGRQNARQREFDKSQAEYAYSKDLAMWEKSNEYNSPKMQMKRFEDAGLNKNMIYGQGSPGLVSVSTPHYQSVKGTYGQPQINVQGILSSFQDIEQKRAQTDLLKQQIELNKQQQAYNFLRNSMKSAFADAYLPEYDEFNIPVFTGTPKASGKLSLLEQDLNAKELRNKQVQETINSIMARTGISENQNKWLRMKLNTFGESNVNIDKDDLLTRTAAEMLGPIIKKFTDYIRRGSSQIIK